MTDPTQAWSPPQGDRLLDGRYRLGDRLGGGAVAEVYRAVDERLQRPVAVKIFRGDAADELQRHEAEMRTLASLDHTSLVTVYDAGSDPDDGRPYLVMQLVDGPTLADLLRDGRLEPDRTAAYGAELADALAYVHGRGFVHRDVKPANVLVSHDGRVHLADFGIARLVDSARVTRTGEVLGTPAYFAPEQVAGEAVGPPADIYALGMVLLECLTGERPFQGTAMEVAMARLSRDPDIPQSVGPAWHELLSAMTRRDPMSRPTAVDAATSLRRLADDGDDATVVVPPAAPVDGTQVMPAVAAAPVASATATTHAPYAPAPAVPAGRRRRGPAVLVVALVLVLVAAVAVAAVLATRGSSSGGSGQPTVSPSPTSSNPTIENDLQKLEKLVRR